MHDKCRDIVEILKQSPIKVDIIRFFKENPSIMDGLPGLAIWIFRPKDMLAPSVKELVSLGIIRMFGPESSAIYAYTIDKDIRACIQEHWQEIECAIRKLRASQAEQEGEHEGK